MKRYVYITIALLFATSALFTSGCGNKDSWARTTKKESIKEIEAKAIKDARKQAKKYRKQGYKVSPGSLPMDKMLEYTWIKLVERNDNGELKYLKADGNGVANTRSAAYMQAFELAKVNLAGQMETMVRAIIEGNVGNDQLNNEEAETITRVLSASKNVIATKLNRVDPVFIIHRDLKNKNVEVNVKLVYSKQNALRVTRDAIREKMSGELDGLQGKLDDLMGI